MSTTAASKSVRICIFIPSFGNGGVERMLVNLAKGLSKYNISVDFVVTKSKAFLKQLPQNINLLEVKSRSSRSQLNWLIEYLTNTQPSALISAKTADDKIALRAKKLTQVKTAIYLRPGTNFSERRKTQKFHPIKRWLVDKTLKYLFNAADGIIAVSKGVAEDVINISGVSPDKITVIKNPVVTPELFLQAEEPPDHPWLTHKEIPVIMSIGRLSNAKDYPTLLHAFKILRTKKVCRLIILGNGQKKDQLLQLSRSLNISEDVDFPGFKANPYTYLARANLFVLSSKREGSPNVLVEALALGIPCVSTDCNSGPSEILDKGQFGILVPVGNHKLLATAMLRTLENPIDSTTLKSATNEYRFDQSARRYIYALGLESYLKTQ